MKKINFSLLLLMFFAGKVFAAVPVINSITPDSVYNDNDGATEASVNIMLTRLQDNLSLGNFDTTSPCSANRVDGHDLYVFSKAFGSQPGG